MTSVHAEALALVNWRGLFYERFELDRHVTGLEGDNGSGKTTVMIAAYVVLMPDMTRLRFTNLGESGATGGDKGLWGRLGETGRPSYSALDFRSPDGSRLVAGVHLERKGEPVVEPTPFVITGLANEVRLQDVFLLAQGDSEVVPEISELRDNVALVGGRLRQFGSAREYFSLLFDQGVLPMRLGTDHERNKLNEMLRTSMTGGMSRGLLSELRSFLLKEEPGLAETLQRMRANLDACRRTRDEVQEAQRLEQEVASVQQAGEEMFAAAIAATRERAEEAKRQVELAEAQRNRAEEEATRASDRLEEVQARLADVVERRNDLEAAVEAARTRVLEIQKAIDLAREVQARRSEHARAAALRADAERLLADAEAKLTNAEEQLREAAESHVRAANGLADQQRGLEELHRRASAHDRAKRSLHDARRLLDRPNLHVEAVPAELAEAKKQLNGVDDERITLVRRIGDASAHREEHARAMEALLALRSTSDGLSSVYEAARDALEQVRLWKELASRREELGHELRAAEAELARRDAVKERAQALGLTWDVGNGRSVVASALEEAEQAIEALEDRVRRARSAETEARQRHERANEEIVELESRADRYRDLASCAGRIETAYGAPIPDPDALRSARTALEERRLEGRTCISERSALREEKLDEASKLVRSGGRFPEGLLRLRDDLAGEMLAARFDEIAQDEAASLEARLGPLAQAVVVADVDVATERVKDRSQDLPTVLLVAEDADLSGGVVRSTGWGDVIVDDDVARRITRVPNRPVVGRAAREQRAAELTSDSEDLLTEIDALRRKARAVDSAIADADTVLQGIAIWSQGDPSLEIEASRVRAVRAGDDVQRAVDDTASSAADADAFRPRRRALRALLPEAGSLDDPDGGRRVADLRSRYNRAKASAARLAELGDRPDVLGRHIDALKFEPWSEDEVSAANVRLDGLNDRRDALQQAVEALEHLEIHGTALRWTDAAARLAEHEGLVPALRAQLEDAKAAREWASEAEANARTARNAAKGMALQAVSDHDVAARALAESTDQLEATGVNEPTDGHLQAARATAQTATNDHAAALAEHDGLREEVGVSRNEMGHRTREAEEARAFEEDQRRQARPAAEAWARLRTKVEESNLLASVSPERIDELFGVRGSVNLYPEAKARHKLLLDRLGSARGGPELLARLEYPPEEPERLAGETYLRTWLSVRNWLRSRLPAHIAEVDEPGVALDRFRDHLSDLVTRLERQERELRGSSEDVARGIDVQIRKARGRVQRLTKHLAGVSFGSIQAIRVKMEHVETMTHVLHALRSGDAQGLLFQADMPIEDALEMIFRRYAGGRTGGQKLLDYREYIQLVVEVQRDDDSGWVAANPTRLSTGEAIGVGAALMMVVLTEWEHDARLLRGRRSHGSLRFLFLDEANRLDHANFGTVLDLCRNLGLQLLVAAPDVARAEGCTVYRLVRTRDDEGRENVLVSGRRAVAAPSAAGT